MQRNRFWLSARWMWPNIFFAFLFVVAIFYRLRLGVEFTDESQYVGQAMMLINGGRAFVNDLFYQQTASWTLIPFYKAFLLVNGTSDGIFLFTRELYFFFSLGCSLVLFLILRRRLGLESILLCLMNFLFVPFSVPSISYNTISINLVALAVACSWILFSGSRSIRASDLATLTFSAAILFYPTLLLVLIIYWFFIWIIAPKLLKRTLALSAFVGIASLLLLVFMTPNSESLLQALSFTRQHGALRPVSEFIANSIQLVFPAVWFYLLPPIIVCAIYLNFFNYSIFYCFAFVAAVFHAAHANQSWPINNIFVQNMFSFVLWSIVCHAVLKGTPGQKRLAFATVSFILIICLNFSFTSSNGLLSATFGMCPLIIFSAWYFPHDKAVKARLIANIGICVFLIFGTFEYVYREEPISRLTAKVLTSPFRGLYTTQRKSEFLSTLDNIAKFQMRKSRVFSYYFFPAIYTWNEIYPQTNALYYFFACTDVSRSKALSNFIGAQVASSEAADYLILSDHLDFDSEAQANCAPDFTNRVLPHSAKLVADLGYLKIFSR